MITYNFLARTSQGLIDTLNEELHSLGFHDTQKTAGGVFFKTDWEGCYKANLCLRTSSRVVLPIIDFTANNGDELYKKISLHDFTQYIDPNGTIAVDASIRESPFRDQRYVAMKIKDAIVDQFRDKFGYRPNVDSNKPHLLIVANAIKHQMYISIDTSGEPLFKRGYRVENVPAPVKEHCAAALIKMTKWDQSMAIVDPMCGSGTFLIEAAMMALNIAPGVLRTNFGFQKLKNFNQHTWKTLSGKIVDQEKESLPFQFYGYDKHPKAVQASQMNVEAAGLSHVIQINHAFIENVIPPCSKGMIIVNPPYGERLQDKIILRDVYSQIGKTLKSRFQGWRCWVLSGDKELIRYIALKSSQKYKIFNGPIECRFLKYDIH